MFSLIPKIPLYKSFRRLGKPILFPINLTLNVTYRCNSRCATCNIWKKTARELELSEWEKIFQGIGSGKIFWLILSGGEPFLKTDLVDLCRLAGKYLQPKIINIPTNGYLYQLIPLRLKEILAAAPQAKIIVNFSLDGLEEDHDRIRNLEKSFKNLLKSYRAVQEIKSPRLTVGIHSVISKLNYEKIPEIYNFVQRELQPDSYITEIAERRKELDNFHLEVFPDEKNYQKAIDFLLEEMNKTKARGLSKITQSLRKNYYQLVKKILKKKTQVIPCYAGFASAQISAEGEVWPCCVRGDNLGNLRENNYDFGKIWSNKKAQAVRESIKKKECWCPLASASYTNMLMHETSLAKIAKEYFF